MVALMRLLWRLIKMVLSMPGGLFKQDDVRETAVSELTSGERVPVGAILPWLKTFAGTPSLPTGYVECAGQVLNDGESVYDGETIPNLNSTNRFLRGNTTSGGTGGESTHTLITSEMPAHIHQFNRYLASAGAISALKRFSDNSGAPETVNTTSTGGDGAHENKPPYYNIVWIMRIK